MIYTANSAPSTNLQWLSTLNTDDIPTKNYRKSSIIGTIGEYRQQVVTSMAWWQRQW